METRCDLSRAVLALVLPALAVAAPASADRDLDPAIRGIAVDGNPRNGVPESTAVDFFGVMFRSAREDRAFAEFDITSQQIPVISATFNSGVMDWDSTGSASMELWGYVGDNAITLADWSSGDELIESFQNGLDQPFSIDVTDYVNDRVAAGDPIVGFALRQTSSQLGRKYWAPQTLSIVPEPSATALGLAALTTLLVLRRLRPARFARRDR